MNLREIGEISGKFGKTGILEKTEIGKTREIFICQQGNCFAGIWQHHSQEL